MKINLSLAHNIFSHQLLEAVHLKSAEKDAFTDI